MNVLLTFLIGVCLVAVWEIHTGRTISRTLVVAGCCGIALLFASYSLV